MPKFGKKPIIVEAEQWFPGKAIDGVYTTDIEGMGWIDTLEGGHIVSSGDWIITGVAGEKYPCKPDIFKATYEPLSSQQKEDLE